MGQQHHRLYFPLLPTDPQGYIDFFSENATNKDPLILQDGTSVQFPNGWTDEDVDKWRKGMQLQRPANYRAVSMDMAGVLTGLGFSPYDTEH
jgi:hypothetical protein